MTGIMERHIARIREQLEAVRETQLGAMEQAAAMLSDAVLAGNAIFAFGCTHAGLLAKERFYRTGGLAVINYVRMPGLALDICPPTLTTDMERMTEYGAAMERALPLRAGDVLLLHSVSGRNAASVELALRAGKRGVKTLCLTNLSTTTRVPSRHPGGRNLYEVCDLVLDNCGDYGDATLELPGFPQRIAPSSTSVGAVMLNAVVARCVERLLEAGLTPPVFISSNIPGGDAHNVRIMEEYRDRIFYRQDHR